MMTDDPGRGESSREGPGAGNPARPLPADDLVLTRLTVDRSPDPIWWMGPDGRLLYANELTTSPFSSKR